MKLCQWGHPFILFTAANVRLTGPLAAELDPDALQCDLGIHAASFDEWEQKSIDTIVRVWRAWGSVHRDRFGILVAG